VAGAALTARPAGTLAELPAPDLVDRAHRLSSADVTAQAAALAKTLQRTHVSFVADSSTLTIVRLLACWRAGATAVPLHHRLTEAERTALRARLPAGSIDLGTDAGARSDDGAAQPVDPASIAVLLATSGSSGRPKLVQHASGALAYKGRLMADVHGLGPDDVVLMPAPLAHVSGLLNGVLVPGSAGMTVVLMDRWSPDVALDLVEREQVSFLIGPPTYFVQLMALPSFTPDRVASVRLISCGGAGVTAEFAQRAAGAFDAVVKRTYGSTEAPTVTTSYADDPPELGWSTDGRPVGDVELRVDPGTSELAVRGRELFVGYADTEDPRVDGWYRTGDRAVINDRRLTILGRIGDTIIRGGENVDPAEVERVCASLPGVGQVVVVGYSDEVMGERVGLVVVGREPPLDEVRAHCADAGLARFKTPERVLHVAELPVLTVGKPDRVALSTLF
jgi:acyl-CoA synthetase (AMP-forming)/AMP-acid ligase II